MNFTTFFNANVPEFNFTDWFRCLFVVLMYIFVICVINIHLFDRRRRSRPDNFERGKRNRQDYQEGYGKGVPGRERSPVDRFNVRRNNYMNGGYGEYVREYFHQRPAVPSMTYGAPAPFLMEPQPYYDRMVHPDYSAQRPRPMDKRAYERSVDDFLRRTARTTNNRIERRYRDRR